MKNNDKIRWQVEQFDDIKILQYRVPNFENLSLNQKTLVYFLVQAALSGRDILFDQHFSLNLQIRKTLEAIYQHNTLEPSEEYDGFVIYLKKVWFASGIHHHYSNDKFVPDFSPEFFDKLIANTPSDKLPAREDIALIRKAIFEVTYCPKRLTQDTTNDLITNSAVNFYENLTQKEVEDFYNKMGNPSDNQPISYGLNSKLVKENGTIKELTYKTDGLYGAAIKEIVKWLTKAADFAENEQQKQTIEHLIEFYNSGELKTFDRYSISWVLDTASQVDFVNGFIENYTDPMGLKATWESIVNFKDIEATKRTETLSSNAQWFEDNSPVATEFKKPVVKGVSAKVITAAIVTGDCYPAAPIGINLPNADWIRRDHGSKSVTIGNFTHSYEMAAQGSGFAAEFHTIEIQDLLRNYGAAAKDVAIDLHECLGHGSGQLSSGVKGDELKNYGSALEETRAELFALYYITDPKMVTLNILPSLESGKAEYNSFIFNAIMGQLTRIKLGETIQQAHMRSRQLIGLWARDLGAKDNIIQISQSEGKTYIQINDYGKLRIIFGQMLAEIQRIKSLGDYEAGKNLIEKYAVNIDPALHQEVLERYATLGIAPYSGFINPHYEAITDNRGKITDVVISHPEDYAKQHLYYSTNYSFL